LLLQNIRNEPWIQIIVVFAVFIIGIVLLKSYNKYTLKSGVEAPPPAVRRKRDSLSIILSINLIWLIFNLLGIFISFFLFNFDFFYMLNIIDSLMIIINIIIGSLLYMKRIKKDIKKALITITIIQIILSGIGIFFNLIFKVYINFSQRLEVKSN